MTSRCRDPHHARFSFLIVAMTIAALTAIVASAAAQTPPSDLFLHGVPAGEVTTTPVALSLSDAIKRGLDNNLGGLVGAQRVRAAEGARWRALGDLLPHAAANLRQSDQLVNVAAYGFTGFPGLPSLIGPYNVFDARVAVSTPLIDAAAFNNLRAETATLKAEQYTQKNTREWVVLTVGMLYLQAVADASRAEAAGVQLATAGVLAQLAEDQKSSGLVAGIDVLRQQVQLAAARQRLIAAENVADKDKLNLARAIGLPPAQAFDLTDRLPYVPAPAMTLEQATEQAWTQRDDLRSAEARADAARAARKAAMSDRLPTVHLDADYGALGSSVSAARSTYAMAATVHVPLFQGGITRGKVEQADAELRQREAELADLKAGIQYDVASALLDLKAADAAVDAARRGESLAREQVAQAQDRFQAGVASTIELVQAQDALAAASDRYIGSLYGHNMAKASLARALGSVEQHFSQFVGGQR
jgi:outer membrane protein TolC